MNNFLKSEHSSKPVTLLYDALIPEFSVLLESHTFSFCSNAFTTLSPSQGWCGLDGQVSGRPENLSTVEFLFVRSTTRVDRALLQLMPALRFVATATSGIDHLNIDDIEQAGVHWCDAKGSNAHAVADYVIYVLAGLQSRSCALKPGRAVIVGFGCVGRQVAAHLTALGCQPSCVDPFIDHSDHTLEVLPLSQQCENWLSETSLLMIHTPFRKALPWPTHHWLSEERLAALPDGSTVICAGRGEVLQEQALLTHANRLHFVLDVWPNEPYISIELIKAVQMSTPHIAGHSRLGKLKGTWQVFQAFAQWLGFQCVVDQFVFLQRGLARERLTGECGVLRVSLEHQVQIQFDRQSSSGCVTVLKEALQNDLLQSAAQPLVDLSHSMRLKMTHNDTDEQISKIFYQLRKAYFQHLELHWCDRK